MTIISDAEQLLSPFVVCDRILLTKSAHSRIHGAYRLVLATRFVQCKTAAAHISEMKRDNAFTASCVQWFAPHFADVLVQNFKIWTGLRFETATARSLGGLRKRYLYTDFADCACSTEDDAMKMVLALSAIKIELRHKHGTSMHNTSTFSRT